LVELQLDKSALTEERAAVWQQNLRRLIEQGPAGVPAIQEFLARNVDYVFGEAGWRMLGYSSARQAMFDALAQIGGPDAVNALAGVLRTTADPVEVAVLAQQLDKLEPQQHQAEALNAARQALALADGHKLGTSDVAPLFEVFQKYGGAEVVPELEKAAGHWNYYGTIALAQLPDGAGIPSLIQIAQDPKAGSSTRDAAFQMLAQAAPQSPEALATLVEQARAGGISDFAWLLLTPVVGGDQVGYLNSAFDHLQGLPQVGGLRTTSTSDNQNFFAIPGNLTEDQAAQRIVLLDELMSATTNPTARDVLQRKRDVLSMRVSRLAALPPQ
jgi:hypothetical protein